MKAILGKKIGMTQVYAQDGTRQPVTVVEVADVYVTKHLPTQGGRIEIGMGKQKKANQADSSNYKNLGFVPVNRATIKVQGQAELPSVGTKLGADLFNVGEAVSVVGTSRGLGFQGVVKRWGFSGGPKTHGQSDKLRSPGSIGSGTTPGRVIKGKRMAGRMGGDRTTIKGLEIVSVDAAENLIAVSGALPGYNGSLVMIMAQGEFPVVQAETVEIADAATEETNVEVAADSTTEEATAEAAATEDGEPTADSQIEDKSE